MTVVKNVGKKKVQSKIGDILSVIDGCTQEEDLTPWSGTLEEYLPLVVENPYLNELAHARIWRMIESEGILFDEKDDKKKLPLYNFYKKELFGVDHVLAQIMQYFKAAAAGSEVSRRILLLWGPTSSGKSQFAIMLKKGLEAFSRTHEGRIFAIDGCPMYENPLNAIPLAARKTLEQKYGLIVEGELCPKCAYRLENEFNGDWKQLPVKRIFLSETNRIGIGTFQPGDTKCLSGDTKILTDMGLLDIEELEKFADIDDNIDINIIKENGEVSKATKFFKYNNKEVVNINCELNYNITATPNHPLMIVDEDGNFIWKHAGMIREGDTLVMGRGRPNFAPRTLPKNKLGLEWNSDLAWFLGVFVAEGSYRRNTIEIANCNEELKDRIQEFADIIGAPTIRRPERITLTSKLLVEFLKDLGFQTGAHNKDIPDVIYQSGHIVEFLRGMWLGDGNLGKHKTKNSNEAGYSSVSKKLIKKLQYLLLTIGVPSSYSEELNVGTSGSFRIKIHGPYVKKLQETLSLSTWKITRDLTETKFSSPNCMRIPQIDGLIKQAYTRCWKGTNFYPYIGKNKSRFSKASFAKFIEQAKINNVDDEIIKKLEQINDDNLFYVDVKSISCGIADVYDIEVPEEHYFIANGFISHNSQSQSELVGSVNFAKLEDYGVESHPLAYNFDGELNVANRGMMEFIELLKVDPKFRHILLTLAQEKRIKVERFPLIYADLVAISHTNETEFNSFIADKKEEALHDRLWVVKFPYNLKLDEEVKIYEKLICQTPGFQGVHIAPHTLKIAAMFAILSRLEEPKDKSITLLQKMRLYNGEHVDGFSPENVKVLQEEAEREGLDGVSPRYIVNRLAACFAKHDIRSVTPIAAIRSLKEGLSTNAKLDKDQVSRLENVASICIEEYSKIATNDVQKAFFVNFDHEIKNLLSNYIDNVGAYLDDTKVENEWGDLVEADERLMRNVEEKVEITSSGKDSFRQEVYRKMIKTKSETGEYDYQSHPKLRDALQKQLFDERKDVIRLTVSSRNPDPEGLKKLNAVVSALVDKYGYNAESANELLRYVSDIMSKNN